MRPRRDPFLLLIHQRRSNAEIEPELEVADQHETGGHDAEGPGREQPGEDDRRGESDELAAPVSKNCPSEAPYCVLTDGGLGATGGAGPGDERARVRLRIHGVLRPAVPRHINSSLDGDPLARGGQRQAAQVSTVAMANNVVRGRGRSFSTLRAGVVATGSTTKSV